MHDLLEQPLASVGTVFARRRVDEGDERRGRDTAKDEVYIGRPSPGHLLGEDTAEKGTYDTCDAEDFKKKSRIYRALVERHGESDNDQYPGEDARRTDTRDGSADHEGGGSRSDPADEGAQFRKQQVEQEDPSHAEALVEAAEEQRESAQSEQVYGSIPASIVEYMKQIVILGMAVAMMVLSRVTNWTASSMVSNFWIGDFSTAGAVKRRLS